MHEFALILLYTAATVTKRATRARHAQLNLETVDQMPGYCICRNRDLQTNFRGIDGVKCGIEASCL